MFHHFYYSGGPNFYMAHTDLKLVVDAELLVIVLQMAKKIWPKQQKTYLTGFSPEITRESKSSGFKRTKCFEIRAK